MNGSPVGHRDRQARGRTAQALDLVFIQEGLFFQKLNRRTILVADQNRRAQYQQLAIRTFYLANIKPEDAEHNFRWVACSGAATDVTAYLDKAEPPSGRCIKTNAS